MKNKDMQILGVLEVKELTPDGVIVGTIGKLSKIGKKLLSLVKSGEIELTMTANYEEVGEIVPRRKKVIRGMDIERKSESQKKRERVQKGLPVFTGKKIAVKKK